MKLINGLLKVLFFVIAIIYGSAQANNENNTTNKNPRAIIDSLNQKGTSLFKKYPDSANQFFNQALKIAEEASFSKDIARTNRRIGYSYFYKKDFDSSLYYLNKSIQLAEKIDDYTNLASSYQQIAIINYINNDFDKAIKNNQTTIEYFLKNNDSSTLANSMYMIGVCYYQMGDYPKSLEAYQNALYIAEAVKDSVSQGNILNNIGNIQDGLLNYSLALQYFQQSLNIRISLKDNPKANSTRENMATVYSKTEEYERALEQYKSVLQYKIVSKDETGMAITLMNLGYVNEKMGKFQNALDYYTQSLILLYKLDDSKNLSTCLNNIGDIHYALGHYQQAIDSSAKSLEIAKKLKLKTSMKSSAYSLTQSFVKQNNYREAYYNHVLYSEMKDSLFNEESAKLLQEMETKYQTEKKQQEIEKQALTIDKQKAQSRSQQIMLLAMLGGLVLVILIAVQVYRGYKQKKKANALLSAKNDEITLQKKEIEEKNLNIMDSIRYAKRIQQTILPRDQFVEKHLPESFILYKPKDIVSGDFYWFEKVGRKVFVAAVDCTGHGVPGAFVSIVGYNNLNRTVMEFHLTKPGDILNKLNDLVVDTFVRHSDSDVKDGMDMSLVSIDLDSKQVEFAGAQNPIYVANRNSIEEVKADKQPIGSSLEPKVFENNVVQVQTGDMVYLFSDGYIDQFGGPQGKKFMRKRFKEMLGTICNLDVKTQKQHLDNTIVDWMKNEEQLDDILVIGIRIT
jgi:serine phosphatase RsbU (regulator of sigma subunit)